jgi:hypothetical protein
MSVGFELAGQSFVALNGGPHFKFDEAISFQVYCDSQTEVDHFWSKLSAGGEEGPCGWLKDKFGLSWQVVPVALLEMLMDTDARKPARDEGLHADEEIRHRSARARLRRTSGLSPSPQSNHAKGVRHASSALSAIRRPLRGGDRVLQIRARRKG